MFKPVRIICLPHPFSQSRRVAERRFDARVSLADIAAAEDMLEGHVLAIVGGAEVPREWWGRISPKPGTEIILRRVPTGGGGNKNPLAAVLSIASFFVPAFGPSITIFGQSFSLGQILVKGALFLIGNSLSKPPSQRLGTVRAADAPTFQLTGASNKAAAYGPIPRLYGRHRIYPPYAAQPYSEVVGGVQYLNCLFDFGYGPLKFEDFRIGATPLANYREVEMEVRPGYASDPPLTLYRNDVSAQNFSILVTVADGPRVINTSQPCDEATLGLVFAEGLVTYDPKTGDALRRNCSIQVDYRSAGSGGPWLTDGVQSTNPTPTTAATLVDSTATSKTYRTDSITYGAVNVTVTMTPGAKWRVSTRRYGDTVWVQQAAIECPATGGYVDPDTSEYIDLTGPRVVNLVVTKSQRAEILVEQAPGVTPAAAPTVTEVAYKTNTTGHFLYTAAKATAHLVTARVIFPARGQYEVRVTRTASDESANTVRDRITWTTLNSIAYQAPVTAAGHALVALRIRATEQLNGVIQEFSAIGTSLLKTWDGAAWTDWTESKNPAWVYADILCGSANARALDRSRLDTAALKTWADDCAAAGIEFNGIFDFRTTVFEAARDVAAVGRASFHMRDGLYSVAQDKPQATPVQHFTPRNSWGYSGTRRFVDLPHAVKVRFLNRDRDWQQDERIVPDDGWTTDTASVFEVLELFGIDSADEAWKRGRFQIANARLRPEEHAFHADVEHIVCNRGDLIRFSHDVPLFGLGYGRLKAVNVDGSSNVTAAALDAEIVMEAAKSYALRIRRANGVSVVAGIDTVAGGQTSVTFTTPIPAASAPAAGDLFLFGISGQESVELIVTGIEPRSDHSALITCVDYAPAVYAADAGAIPPFDSQISTPATWTRQPAAPVIESIASDETVLVLTPDGGYQAVIRATISIPAGGAVPPDGLEVAWRISGSDAWESLSLAQLSPAVATLHGVAAGQTYDIRARTTGSAGESSDWTETTHTVVGAATAPPGVTDLLLRNDGLIWSHEQPRDHAGYRVRYHAGTSAEWETATAAHIGLVTDTPFPVASLVSGGGLMTFLVKAVDLAGNESADAAVLATNLGDALTDNIILQHDEHPAFAGTVANGSVVSGELKADGAGSLFWGSETAAFWSSPAATFWTPGYAEMSYTFSLTPSAWESGPGRVLLDYAIDGNGFSIEYRRAGSDALFWGADGAAAFWGTGSALFWTPPADWAAWPGEVSPISAAGLDFRVTAFAGTQRGTVSTLSVLLDVPDVVEYIDDAAISAGGSRLALTQDFRVIKNVQITLQDTGTGARTVVVQDKDATLGPLLQPYNGSNAACAASVDGVIQGY